MKKVLIVEDDKALADIFQTFLTERDYEAHVAYDGAEAIEAFHREVPDLIVLDIALPRRSGFEVAYEVRHSSDGAELPMIFISAVYAEPDSMERKALAALNPSAFLVKPFRLPDLANQIGELIGAS